MADRHPLAPSTGLAAVYFAGAHVALTVALVGLIVDPGLPFGLDARPRLTALVHLLTLGWISGSILGALHLVLPLAFAVRLEATALDRAACAVFWAGTALLTSGFWARRFGDLPLASALVVASIAVVGVRVLRALWRAPLPVAIPVHLALAFGGIVTAGAAGWLMAFGYEHGTAPWASLPLAEAHAHLAVLGWVVMMIFGVAYRLLPMVLPAAMPTGWTLLLSAAGLEVGTLGLAAALAFGGDRRGWALAIVAGFLAFFAQVVRILRQRRPAPAELPRPDWSTRHTALALSYGLATAVLGAWLVLGAPPLEARWAYGAAGLLGFAAQMVVGIAGRLLPLQVWFHAMQRSGGTPPPLSSHRLARPRLAATVFWLWLVGLPVLIGGLVDRRPALVAWGAAALAAATLVNAWHGLAMLARVEEAARSGAPVVRR